MTKRYRIFGKKATDDQFRKIDGGYALRSHAQHELIRLQAEGYVELEVRVEGKERPQLKGAQRKR